jgi:hypothetical protein
MALMSHLACDGQHAFAFASKTMTLSSHSLILRPQNLDIQNSSVPILDLENSPPKTRPSAAQTHETLAMSPLSNLPFQCSEGQEKYLRELSITPVGYFTGAIKNHSCGVSHGNYFAWRK